MEKANGTTQISSSVVSICSLKEPTNPFSTITSHIDEATLEDQHHNGLLIKNPDCNIVDLTESAIVLGVEPPHPLVPTFLDSSDRMTYSLSQQQWEDLNNLMFINARANDRQSTSLDTSRGEGRSDVLTNELGQTQEEVSEMLYQESYYEILKDANLDEGLVDTAAPFESVKEAASKFGGIADWKAQKSKTIEQRKHLLSELERTKEEIPRYKLQSEDAEALRIEVLTELDHTRRLIEELKLSLEKAETQEAQARQDSQLAELRAREMEQGISNSVSIAAKAQLDVAKGRHENAVAELEVVRREVETMQREYASLVHDSDGVMRKAKDSVSTSKEMERNVEDLTLELITAKEMLDSAHSVHLEVEENRIDAVLSLEQDRMSWERELKTAEAQLCMLNEQIQTTDDVKFKLDTTCALLAGLKVELASLKNVKSNQQEDDGGFVERELQDVRTKIKRSKDEIDRLRRAACSLKHELDQEQKYLTALSGKEQLVPASVSLLPLELGTTSTAPEQVEHELRKAREEAEQTKAAVRTAEARLNAVIQEIEASKASSKAMVAMTKSGGVVDHSTVVRITLQTEEYYKLRQTAQKAKEHANKRVLTAIEQIKSAKASELRTSRMLQEAIKELEGRRKTLKAAMDNAERTKEAKAKLENELQMCRTEHELQRKDSSCGGAAAHDDDEQSDVDADGTIDEQKATQMARSQTMPATKLRKRLFLPRLLMFLARKKAQSLK